MKNPEVTPRVNLSLDFLINLPHNFGKIKMDGGFIEIPTCNFDKNALI